MYKIKVYKKGSTFYHENYELISSNLHYEIFFRLDAENLIKASKQEFAISINEGYKRLCVIRTVPFNAIYIGDSDLAPILADYLVDNRFVLTDFSAPKEVGIKLMDQFNKRHINCTLKICMNYMKCLNSNLIKDERVINAQEEEKRQQQIEKEQAKLKKKEEAEMRSKEDFYIQEFYNNKL